MKKILGSAPAVFNKKIKASSKFTKYARQIDWISTRRSAIAFAISAILAPGSASATDHWPSKPIKMIVPVAAGGVLDVVARRIAPLLSQELGQPIVVENRPGADYAIATVAVARSAPDGHTWLFGANTGLTSVPLMKKVPYDPLKDLITIDVATYTTQIFVVPSVLGISSLDQFVRLAKSKPGSLNYGNPAFGSFGHLNVVLLARAAGIDIVPIAYPGNAPALADLISNRIQLLLAPVSVVLPQIKAGMLVPVAVGGSGRTSLLPDVPTVKELGYPGAGLEGWLGPMLPAKTPSEILDRANQALHQALKNPELRGALEQLGTRIADPLSPSEAKRQVEREINELRTLFKAVGIKPEY